MPTLEELDAMAPNDFAAAVGPPGGGAAPTLRPRAGAPPGEAQVARGD